MSGSELELERSEQFTRRLKSDLQKALEAASGNLTLRGVLKSVYPLLYCPPYPSGAKVAQLISGALEAGRSINLTAVFSLDTISGDLPIVHRVVEETFTLLNPTLTTLFIADWPWVEKREVIQGLATLTGDSELVTAATERRFHLAREQVEQLSWPGHLKIIEIPTPDLHGVSPIGENGENLLIVNKRLASRTSYRTRQTPLQTGRQAAIDYLMRMHISNRLNAASGPNFLPVIITVKEDPSLLKLYGGTPVFNLSHKESNTT